MSLNYASITNTFSFKLFLCIFISILPLACLELGLTIKDYVSEKKITAPEDEMTRRYPIKYTYAPYLLWRAVPNQISQSFTTNSLGLRSPEINIEEKIDRVIFIGGSTMWGYGSQSNETTIPFQVKKILKDKYSKNIEIINLSENGYTSTQEFILWNDVLNLKPKVVIHLNGYNDLYTGHSGKPAGWNHDFIYEDLLVEDNNTIISSLLRKKIKEKLETFRLYRWIDYKINELYSLPKKEVQRTDLVEVVETYKNNILLVSQLAKANKISLIIINQPNIFVDKKIKTSKENEIIKTFESYYADPATTQEYFSHGHTLQQRELEIIGKKYDIPIVNGNSFFNNREDTIYLDPAHINDAGNYLIAETLSKLIVSSID